MTYQIRFENQPSATAPAQRVTVTDTLDPNLDLSTFELTEIAFANQTLALPAGLNHYETRLAFTVTNQTLLPQTGLAALGSRSPPRCRLPRCTLTRSTTSRPPLCHCAQRTCWR